MLYHYATTFLSCEGDSCQLKIIPPHRQKQLNLKLDRNQIVTVKTFQVDEHGEMADAKNNRKGEMYESYGIVLNQYGKDAALNEFEIQRDSLRSMADQALTRRDMEEIEMYGSAAFTDPDLHEKFLNQKKAANAEKQLSELDERTQDASAADAAAAARRRYDLPNLEPLVNYASLIETEGQYLVIMRRYNVRDRKRRVSSLVNKINLYSKGTKDRLIIRENRNIVWQGIVGMVFGIFSLLLSLILGQFVEPQKTRTRGPGSRSQFTNYTSYSSGEIASFPSRPSRPASMQHRPKAYGGYVPTGKSSYSY